MADLRRQLEAARRRADRLQQEVDDLRATHGWFDPEYCATIRVLVHLATSGLKRGQDLGTLVDDGSDNTLAYSAWAYDQLRKQRADQRKESAELRSKIRMRFNNGHAEEAPNATEETPQRVRLA